MVGCAVVAPNTFDATPGCVVAALPNRLDDPEVGPTDAVGMPNAGADFPNMLVDEAGC